MTVPPRSDAPPAPAECDRIAGILAQIACEAGAILRRFEQGECRHRLKEDGSPTSQADLAAEEHILASLARTWPDITVVAEETASTAPAAALFFLVDPLDGTRDFLRGIGEYSVNIALVAVGRPVAAALAAPALGRVWSAGDRAVEAPIRDGRPGEAAPIRARPAPAAGLTALTSRSHGEAADETCLAALPVHERRPTSSALKFGLIACGEADLYVRCGPTMEWDTAAGDHIVTRAGGCVVGPDGRPLAYGRQDRHYRNGSFATLGDRRVAGRLALPGTGAPRFA
ncbi:3'(2'),5'-bisphosphate nucleotidase CysQ [uncultured Methylobacterium sp.]|jgi:3'(2'), 5'-bisphosphate nucleotidase|uniref:3'(2'),5'-bisphosphate nucleotidase CysQ family protein n=1 Tax=uncultured Methylobacterium sp. TaxID=157278 RepID=UPI0026321C06|nr:3'(2'),5'-bisphosphate nucleotidase CysQ [uncultured Methylobacterium sp.]